jgi:hypothetical protein
MTFDVIKYIPAYTSLVIFIFFLGCNLKKKTTHVITSYYNLGQRSNCQKIKQSYQVPKVENS